MPPDGSSLPPSTKSTIDQGPYPSLLDVEAVAGPDVLPEAGKVSSKADLIGDLIEQAHLTDDTPPQRTPVHSD